jgi:hypothetical protein
MSSEEYNPNYTRKPLPKKILTTGAVLSLLGLCFVAISFYYEPLRSGHLSVVTFLFILSIGAGAMFAVALEYVTGAIWSIPFRRIAEFLGSFVFLSLPFLLPAVLKRELLYGTDGNTVFLYIRLVLIFLIWRVFYYLTGKNSRKQDVKGCSDITKKNTVLSAVFLLFLAFAIYILTIDWLNFSGMTWLNTIEGLYVFAGAAVGGIALWTFISVTLNERGYLLKQLSDDNYYGFGGLMFAFVIFWGYIAFIQILFVWYAGSPVESNWLINRSGGGWQYFFYFFISIQFVLPFFLLLSQKAKMNPGRLKTVAVILLIARFCDSYWLIMTEFDKYSYYFCLYDFAFPLLATGLGMLAFYFAAKNKNLVAIGEPKLKQSTKYNL